MQENPTITAAEIARLAGVGRAAVSNWRKRHPDFPAPVGGTVASPEFDLVEVEQWLRVQGKLPELATADRLWRHLAAVSGSPTAGLAAVGARLLDRHRGVPTGPVDAQLAPLLPDLDALADEWGPQGAFDQLWHRFGAPGPGRSLATPDDLADLMVGLADVAGGVVLDPTAGSGALLRAAVRAGCTHAYGQELDPDLAAVAGLWLALRDVPGEVVAGDSLRADAFAGRAVDAVVCHPPFGATNWGDDELGHDPRWIVGTTPRTEPELAWVQHTLAHLRVGGHAVLLMPPTVASRRAGKRIRGELLRRGHLRAVVALPAGAAAPHAVPLHLWVLRRAAPDAPPPPRVLLVDAAAGGSVGTAAAGGSVGTAAGGGLAGTAARVRAVWRAFAAGDAEVDRDGFARAVPVIELLDEDVDLTPARRQPTIGRGATAEHLVRTRARLTDAVARLSALMPQVTAAASGAPAPETLSVAELVRTGALHLIGPVRAAPGAAPGGPGGAGPGDGDVTPARVLTGRDVVAGTDPSGYDDGTLSERVELLVGDVVVPVAAPQIVPRVVSTPGALLGGQLYLLRPHPGALDPWFLAGQLRSSGNDRQSASLSGTRIDVRRAQIRRLSLDEQRGHGQAYQRLVAWEATLAEVGVLGAELARLTGDGLADGALLPEGQPD
ncbi:MULTISPECIES: N-6 DNA methylase [Micromonospora]|uniref:N-6 DNA Methylase n=1 Tax=Micromonospora yangpuensis TaxID=683228 RepID=A0A1C6UMB0_9ACTN|nr:N-6 DNA methylase [Micromonospora yangpuensis]GGM27710.1 SAM-dependent methyltransferase [Micromonospora yangpuensis]SCL55151.1 N-6 DNA Methylase [Micromonospora yangpuensis]